jgi:hypothetical protein
MYRVNIPYSKCVGPEKAQLILDLGKFADTEQSIFR